MLVILAILICVIHVGSPSWSRNVSLDPEGKYHLYWRFNENVITFQVEVESTGWIGFGISPNGGMSGSDVVIGWVSNGRTSFHDRHAEGKFMPIVDKHQDWELLWSHENDTHTIMRFQRELNTCDREDLQISAQTTRLIYAYGERDPSSANSVMYHGPVNRGTKSLNLLQEGNENRNLGDSNDLFYWNIRSQNVEVPGDVDTAYICTVIKRPHLDKLHHIIKAEPVIQSGHERLVHHMVLYDCTNTNHTKMEALLGHHYCYTEDVTPKFAFCSTVFFAWAIGGEAVYLPEYVGLPFGRKDTVYYVLEVHYDNPDYVKGIIDGSGLRLTYTPKLRKYNGGILTIGSLWYPCVVIPPKMKNFVVPGHVTPSCLRQELPPSGIKIFAGYLHSHSAGKTIRIRHFRGKQELEPIMSDDNYDYNYQSYLMFPEHEILPNDHLIVECNYDTSKRDEATFGGLSTKEEMCLAFVMYYPEVQLSLSLSFPSPYNIVKALGVTQISDDDKFVISSISGKNETYIEFLSSYPWGDYSMRAVQRAIKYSPHINICWERGNIFKLILLLSKYPKVEKAYRKPDTCAARRK